MSLPAISADQLIAWAPCKSYDVERIKTAFAGRQFTAIDLLNDLGGIEPTHDALVWAAMHPEVIPEQILQSVCIAIGGPPYQEFNRTDRAQFKGNPSPFIVDQLNTAISNKDIVTVSHHSVVLQIQMNGKDVQAAEWIRQEQILRSALVPFE